MKKIEMFTDGACSGNPGPGGWGVILRYNGIEKELSGGAHETTNNRMELTAVIEGLKALKEPCEVLIYTDSKYIVDGITLGWAKKWRSNGWKKPDKKPVLNSDLWEQLLNLLDIYVVQIVWVRGHVGHPENERCDRLATAYYKKLNRANNRVYKITAENWQLYVNDEDPFVRKAVAEHGYGLDILINDKYPIVRDVAQKKLSQEKGK